MTISTLEPRVDQPDAPHPAIDPNARRDLSAPPARDVWKSISAADVLSVARQGACAFTVLVILFAGFLWAGSGLQEGRRQTGLERAFRAELATLHAPIGGNIAIGAPVAKLDIAGAGIHEIAVQGTTASQLRLGPGHFRASPLPGQIGNSVMLGRHGGYGGPFRHLSSLRPGDSISVTTGQGVSKYTVTTVGSRSGKDGSAFLPTSDARLTLVSATSSFDASRYEVVVAKLTSKPFAATGRAGTIQRNELGLTGDTSTAPTLFLWLVALAIVVIGITWASRARPGVVVWLLSVPVLLAVLWLVFDSLAPLLPALL